MTSKCFSFPHIKKTQAPDVTFLYLQLKSNETKAYNKLFSFVYSRMLNKKFIPRDSMLYYKTFLGMNKCMFYFIQINNNDNNNKRKTKNNDLPYFYLW